VGEHANHLFRVGRDGQAVVRKAQPRQVGLGGDWQPSAGDHLARVHVQQHVGEVLLAAEKTTAVVRHQQLLVASRHAHNRAWDAEHMLGDAAEGVQVYEAAAGSSGYETRFTTTHSNNLNALALRE